MKKILLLIFILNISLFSIEIPKNYDTNFDNIEYKKNNNFLNINNEKKINIITSRHINIPIKYNLPYRSLNNPNIKVIGNIVKYYHENKIEILNKNELIKQNNLFNKYLDDFIISLKKSKKDNIKYEGCISLIDYYTGTNSCFKLMKMMNKKEKKELNNIINKIIGK